MLLKEVCVCVSVSPCVQVHLAQTVSVSLSRPTSLRSSVFLLSRLTVCPAQNHSTPFKPQAYLHFHPASHGHPWHPARPPVFTAGEGVSHDGWGLPGPGPVAGEGEGEASVTQLPGCHRQQRRRRCSNRKLATGKGRDGSK